MAESQDIANAAAKVVKTTYTSLGPPILSIEQAIEENVPPVVHLTVSGGKDIDGIVATNRIDVCRM